MQTIKDGISRLLKPSTGGSTSAVTAAFSTTTTTITFSSNPCTTCDEPCSTHEQLPATMAKRIDQGQMLHSFKPYFHHLLLRSGSMATWPEKVEQEAASLAELYSQKLSASKKRIMVTLFDESDYLSLSPSATKGIIFPSGLQVSEELISASMADKVVDMLLASAQADSRDPSATDKITSQDTVSPLPEIPASIKSFVLVCAHMKRDKKCGVAGPMLIKEFKKVLKEKGLADSVPTLAVSHIGGHKYAGNVIVYNRDPRENKVFIADWYGRVKTCHVESIVEESILNGRVIEELWRGRMANPSDPNLECFLSDFTSHQKDHLCLLYPDLPLAKDSKRTAHKIFYITEILERIISFVSVSDLSDACQVSKSWYSIAKPRLYKHICFHGFDAFHNVVKFIQSMDWNTNTSTMSLLDNSLVSHMDKARLASLFLQRTLGKVKSSDILKRGGKEALLHLKSVVFQKQVQKKSSGCCKICVHSHALAEKSPVKEMLVPLGLGRHSHRFKGAVYGVVSLKSTKKFKNQPQVKALEQGYNPCLQVHIHPFVSDWTVTKSRLYQTNGPFLRSLTFSSIDVTDEILCKILIKTKNLAFLCISSCPLVTDKVIEVASTAAGNRLTHITLANLPKITDSGIQTLARNCTNLEGVDLTNSINCSEIGVKDLLSMCPFLTLLDLQRLGSGAGYAINDRFSPYVMAYGISLRYLCLAGCALRAQDIEKLINTMPSITTWGLGFMQAGSRNLAQIKAITSAWMKSPCVSAIQLEDYAITLTFGNKRKIHMIGTKDEKVEHLQAIYVSDREGAIVIKACNQMMPKKLLEPSFTASFVLSSEQITKLGIWGKNQSITLRFEEYDIVQFNYSPFILTLIGNSNGGDIDILVGIGQDLKDICRILEEEIFC